MIKYDFENYHYCKDGLGRTWAVSKKAVKDDYVETILMGLDGLSREEAYQQAEEEPEATSYKTYWFWQQILPHADYVFTIGTLLTELHHDKKEEFLDAYARLLGGLETIEENEL